MTQSSPTTHDTETHLSQQFNSIADAELLLQDVVSGNVHLAHEVSVGFSHTAVSANVPFPKATVGTIGLLCNNSRLYCARPFLISGSCKKETAEDHAVLIQTALNAIKSLSNARVVSIASDGEARWGKALVQLTFKHTLSASSPIYPWLSMCPLLDLHVGDNEMMCNKDWKHAGAKHPRNALLREKGVLVYGTWITPTVLQSHLLEAGHKSDDIRSVLNPNDKQDVMLAYNLLRDVWTLSELSSGPPGRIQAQQALCIFGSMCYHILVLYICVDLSLEHQLEYLSYAGHLALALYAHENACGNFLPTALYVDLILMIKNVFFCVAKAKVDTPEEDFSIVLLGTDCLENLFGCLQTMVGNDANVDNFQLGTRLSGTMESANILASHLEWDKAPRRLHLPLVSQDMTTIPNSADHISPRSWSASQSLHSVTPPTVWIQGQRRLEADYPFVSEVLHTIEATPSASMLAPFGTLLVHATFPTDDVEDLSHDDVLHGLAPDALTQDHANTSIISDGMCELENAAATLEWAPKDHAFSNVIELADNGGTVNKCRALSFMFKHSTLTSSTDRLRRVQQQAHFVPFEHDVLPDNPSHKDSDILLVNNPVALLLSCEDRLFLCIGEIIAIHVGSKSIDHLPLDVLQEDTIRVTFQVYSLVCHGTSPDDDSTSENDWRTHEHLPLKFKVPGSLIQPINPCMETPPSRTPFYLFDTATLLSLTSSLHDHLTKPYLKLVPNTVCSHLYPYRERSGNHLLLSHLCIL
jgi:hypothetical protein